MIEKYLDDQTITLASVLFDFLNFTFRVVRILNILSSPSPQKSNSPTGYLTKH